MEIVRKTTKRETTKINKIKDLIKDVRYISDRIDILRTKGYIVYSKSKGHCTGDVVYANKREDVKAVQISCATGKYNYCWVCEINKHK